MEALVLELWGVLVALLGTCVFLQYRSYESVEIKGESAKLRSEFRRFQHRVYLPCYLCAMLCDWVQGPYCYKLYASYGLDPGSIGVLFVAGYGSSMVLGSFVGGLTDSLGRKNMALAYAAIYGASALLKVSRSFAVLLAGRVMSGVSTSLLFSCFEAWMVSEHSRRGFPKAWLQDTFAKGSLGNGVVAIAAGLLATAAADALWGPVSPYLVAAAVLAALFAAVAALWPENYGDRGVDVLGTYRSGLQAIFGRPAVLFLGLTQALFEGSMYCFVFGFSPALEAAAAVPGAALFFSPASLLGAAGGSSDEAGAGADPADPADPAGSAGSAVKVPLGVVFSCFMASLMCGSALFKRLVRSGLTPERILGYTISTAAVCLTVPVLLPDHFWALLAAFCAFECCCGVYFPCQGTLRSKYLRDETRGGVLALFRVPLNVFVLVTILGVKSRGVGAVFAFCVVGLLTSLVARRAFVRSAEREAAKASPAAKATR